MGRLEKSFLGSHQCYADLPKAQAQGLASGFRHVDEVCYNTTAALLEERQGRLRSYWENREVAPHIFAMQTLFPERLSL